MWQRGVHILSITAQAAVSIFQVLVFTSYVLIVGLTYTVRTRRFSGRSFAGRMADPHRSAATMGKDGRS